MTEREQFEAWWPSVGQTIGKAAAWEAWQAARATPALPQGDDPVVELVWQHEGSDAERELRFIDLYTSFDIPVGTKFYLHPPKPQSLPDTHRVVSVELLILAELLFRAEETAAKIRAIIEDKP